MSELSVKQKLHQHCLQHTQGRISVIESALASIEESRNNETKSSAGDKYETGRAMMQQEEEKYRVQLANVVHLQNVLTGMDPGERKQKVGLGSLVITDTGKYYIAIGLGKIKLDDSLYYAVSLAAPISQALLHKEQGDHLHFNGKPIRILEVS